MATNTVATTLRIARHSTLAALVLTAALLSTARGTAQEEPMPPAQVRKALRLAIDNYKRGDFEEAADFFKYAEAGQKYLEKSDLKDLTDFGTYNGNALKSRQEGKLQVQQAAEALQKGKIAEASQILNTLNANQFLSPADRQQLDEMNKRAPAQKPSAPPAPVKGDGKAMLASGRAALQAGDLEAADSWANQAEKASSLLPTLLQPWSDSPAKLRRDIQTAKAKLQPTAPPTPKNEPESKGSSWLPSINLFGKSEKQPDPAAKNPEPAPKQPESILAGFWPFGGGAAATPAKKEPPTSENKVDALIARQAVKDGFIFLQTNELDKARLFAIQAKGLNVVWDLNEQTPDLLLHEIQRRTSGTAPAPLPDAVAAKPEALTAKPDATAKKPAETPKDTDPRALLRQGRTLLQQKKIDEADKICTQAINARARWGLWEDNPDKLRRDIVAVRKVADRAESFKLMVDARKLFGQDQIEEAERKAYKAKQLHGPFGVFDFGDRPDKLLEEINRVKLARGRPNPSPFNPPKDTQVRDFPFPTAPVRVAVEPTPAAIKTEVPAGIRIANKNRAIVMLREARELERHGLLVEARQKGLEARALKAPFQPDEESPEYLLLSLAARSDRQIATHLQQAVELFSNANDPQRTEKSQANLLAARKLAQAFELDASRIDQTQQQLQQVAAGSRPLTSVGAFISSGQDPFKVDQAKIDPTSGDPKLDALHKIGRDKLQYAQRELKHGKYAQARKMAEELFNPAYGLQDDVLRFVRSINAEETNQQILEAMRNFEVAVDALAAKDYQKALYLFQSIDPLLLPEQTQNRMRDIMGMREMQPQMIAQTNKNFLKGGKIDVREEYGQPVQPNDDLLKTVKATESVQFQALRQRGYDALRIAHQHWKDDQRAEALKTLKNFVTLVNEAQTGERIDLAKANELRRPVDARIQQYKAMQAEATLNNATKKNNFVTYHNESMRTSDIQKRQQETVKMMQEASDLFKQNKLPEAAAIARQVLEVDRENGAALAMLNIADTRKKQEDYNRDVRQNEEWMLKGVPNGLGKLVDLKTGVDFDHERIIRRTDNKDSDGAIYHPLKDHKERAIQYRLRQPISLHFKDVPLRQAIKDLAITSGVQVVADDLSLQEARVNMDSPLSVSVENIDMKFALNILLKPLRLTYIIEDQVLKITTENRTIGRLVLVTYPIADLIVPVEDHPLPDVLNMTKAIERSMTPTGFHGGGSLMPSPYSMSPGTPVSAHGSQGLGGAFGPQGAGQGGMPGPAAKERTKDQMAQILKDLIQATVAKDKWEDMGGTGRIQYFPMGLALVISQPQEVQEEIQLLLATLRKLQDLQVSVELRAVLVSETFFERIGLDFDMNIRTPTSRTEPALVTGNFVPAPFINRVGSGLNLISGLTSAGTLTPDLNVPIRNSTFNFTTPQFGGYQPEAGLSLGLAFLSDIQVFMFLEAVQGDRRAHIMQAPKITVYNGQTATIAGFMVRPSVTGVTPVPLANGQLIMIPNITQIPFGLAMTVTPVVSPDRRFIRLNITPQLAQGIQDPAGAIVIAVPSPAIGVFDGGAQQPPFANGSLNVTINPQTANLLIADTTVNVPDGGTVLLGGFKFLAEERTEYGPPILSKIPYLSRLFRNVGWSRDGSTLIYLVTARVIMLEEEENIFLGNIPPIPGR